MEIYYFLSKLRILDRLLAQIFQTAVTSIIQGICGRDLPTSWPHYTTPEALCTNIPAWINNYIYNNAWDEITSTFPNFNGAPIDGLGMDIRFHSTLYDAYHKLSTLGLDASIEKLAASNIYEGYLGRWKLTIIITAEWFWYKGIT